MAQNDKVADIKKGQKAPFSGVLMTEPLATKLYLDSKFSPRECDIKIEEKMELQKIDCKKTTSVLQSKIAIQKEKYDTIISLKDERIDFLEKRWSPSPWYESGEFWFTTGVISGILITIATGYALGQVK